jgi:hypothetical protein
METHCINPSIVIIIDISIDILGKLDARGLKKGNKGLHFDFTQLFLKIIKQKKILTQLQIEKKRAMCEIN